MENSDIDTMFGIVKAEPMFNDLDRFNIVCRMLMAKNFELKGMSYKDQKLDSMYQWLVANVLEIDQAQTDLGYDPDISKEEKIRIISSIQKSSADASNYAMIVFNKAQEMLDELTGSKCPNCDSTLGLREGDIRPHCLFCGYVANV